MSKHTPGPWVKNGIDWFGSNGEKVVISDGPAYGSKTRFRNAEANYRLIMAAPETAADRDRLKEINKELLEALTALLCLHENDVWTDDACEISFYKARAAIAKATGEQQ